MDKTISQFTYKTYSFKNRNHHTLSNPSWHCTFVLYCALMMLYLMVALISFIIQSSPDWVHSRQSYTFSSVHCRALGWDGVWRVRAWNQTTPSHNSHEDTGAVFGSFHFETCSPQLGVAHSQIISTYYHLLYKIFFSDTVLVIFDYIFMHKLVV